MQQQWIGLDKRIRDCFLFERFYMEVMECVSFFKFLKTLSLKLSLFVYEHMTTLSSRVSNILFCSNVTIILQLMILVRSNMKNIQWHLCYLVNTYIKMLVLSSAILKIKPKTAVWIMICHRQSKSTKKNVEKIKGWPFIENISLLWNSMIINELIKCWK